uniref:VWFA domain-containing protein n=1 Tax=Panagrellus redivivus TaxID=6233 RepID=A0A7E4ZVC1_PANRE
MQLRNLTVVIWVTTVAVLLPFVTTVNGAVDALKRDTDKTLFLFIEATTQNAHNFGIVADDLEYSESDIDPSWFSQFVVVGFDSTGVLFANATPTIDKTVDLLRSLVSRLTSSTGCDLPLFEVVIHGLSSFTFNPQSVVYLITTAGSSASDQLYGPTFFKALLGWQVQLQYVLYESTACNNTLDSQGVRFAANLAVVTGGNFVELPSGAWYINAHLPTLQDSTFIADITHGSFSCIETTYYAAIEENVDRVFLYTLTAANDPDVQGPKSYIFYDALLDAGHALIFYFEPIDGPGIYTITINDVGACSVQIRAHINQSLTALSTTVNALPITSPEPKSSTILSTSTPLIYPDVYADITFMLDMSILQTQKNAFENFFINTLSHLNLNGRISMGIAGVCDGYGFANDFTLLHDIH